MALNKEELEEINKKFAEIQQQLYERFKVKNSKYGGVFFELPPDESFYDIKRKYIRLEAIYQEIKNMSNEQISEFIERTVKENDGTDIFSQIDDLITFLIMLKIKLL